MEQVLLASGETVYPGLYRLAQDYVERCKQLGLDPHQYTNFAQERTEWKATLAAMGVAIAAGFSNTVVISKGKFIEDATGLPEVQSLLDFVRKLVN